MVVMMMLMLVLMLVLVLMLMLLQMMLPGLAACLFHAVYLFRGLYS